MFLLQTLPEEVIAGNNVRVASLTDALDLGQPGRVQRHLARARKVMHQLTQPVARHRIHLVTVDRANGIAGYDMSLLLPLAKLVS